MINFCQYCKKEFREGRKEKKYCGRRCKERAFIIRKRRPYMIYKDSKCKICGFIALHPCQLDIDHIDGNHKNNELSNLQTLCSNCHRLKTFLNKDWKIK